MEEMTKTLTRGWWTWALRGAVAILFGAAVLVWPGAGLAVLVALFGAFALVGGIFALVGAAQSKEWDPLSWAMLIEGLLGIGVGVLTFVWPNITAAALLIMIALWAILTGVVEIVASFRFNSVLGTGDSWLLGIAGAASTIFGVLVLARPNAGAVAIIWTIGIYAIISGISLIAFGFRVRTVQQELGFGGKNAVRSPA
jgi:uncharacterized membrane protein HdeD (DUF308 family)